MNAQMTERVKAEFDAFGPWIDEVRTADDVPPLYDDHPLDLTTTRLVLKVPRNMSRRDAQAGMDLYDHLLVMGSDSLTSLSRVTGPEPGGVRYTERTVRYDDVVAVRDQVSLLDGQVRVFARDGSVLAFGYNGAAADGAERLVDELRLVMAQAQDGATSRAAAGRPAVQPGSDPAAPPLAPGALGTLDVALVTAYRMLARRYPGMRVLAMHPRAVVRSQGEGFVAGVRRAVQVFAPTVLQGAVVATDGEFLEVVGRRAGLQRGRVPVHSRSRLVVPLGVIESVEVVPHAVYEGVDVVTIVAGATRLELPVPAGEAAEQVLAGLVRA